MSTKHKYASLEYYHYELNCLNQFDDAFLPLAPKYWDEKIKKIYTINATYPNKKYEELLAVPAVKNTINALNELVKWDMKRMVYQIIVLKKQIYLNPYFKGISDNIFYGRECYIPDIFLPANISIMETKLKMLGGTIVQVEPKKNIDLIIMPRAASKKYNKIFFEAIEKLVFKDIVSLSTLNAVYCKVFSEYNY